MGSLRRTLIVLVTAAVASAGLVAAPALASSSESAFVSRINAERTARGLSPVEVYWDLVDDARAHSTLMRDQDRLHHNAGLGGVTSGWISLGENVGVGPSVSSLHAAFMDSAGHRANILGDYNYVGVGVSEESDTKMWVTIVFMQGPEGLVTPPAEEPPPTQEPPPAEPPPVDEPADVVPPVEEPAAPAKTPVPTASVAAAPQPQPAEVTEPMVSYGRGRMRPMPI